jgi:hypothetical protein
MDFWRRLHPSVVVRAQALERNADRHAGPTIGNRRFDLLPQHLIRHG